jgi:hypothetical protein
MEIMMSAAEREELERAARTLRSAAAAAFTQGMDEDWIYSLVEAGVSDAQAWPISQRMQAINKGEFRPDGADRYASNAA